MVLSLSAAASVLSSVLQAAATVTFLHSQTGAAGCGGNAAILHSHLSAGKIVDLCSSPYAALESLKIPISQLFPYSAWE